MSETIKKFTYQAIVDLLHNAQGKVYWVSPSITIEIAHALNELTRKGINVSVLLDIDPKRFRHYEGELEAIEILKDNSAVNLIKAKNLGLGFIIVDRKGYAFFNPMRAFESDGDRYNAFKLDQETIESLKSLFFNFENKHQDLFELSDSEQVQKNLEIEELEHIDIENTKKELQKDPPLKIDLKRVINVYRTNFQFVDITFSGSKLHIKKVKLPKNALPFKDTRLKNSIESQLRLFSDIPNKDFFKSFFDLKEDYDNMRFCYITHIKSREKNIIRKKDKPDFEKEFSELLDQVSKVKKDLIAKLQEEIYSTKTSVRDNLKQFLISNPTDELSLLKERALESGAEHQANDIVSRINFPSANDLLEKLTLKKYYYDITWEDLNDEEVIKEFKEKSLISDNEMSDLKTMSQAYELQRSGRKD